MWIVERNSFISQHKYHVLGHILNEIWLFTAHKFVYCCVLVRGDWATAEGLQRPTIALFGSVRR